jgi:hypothetical protein
MRIALALIVAAAALAAAGCGGSKSSTATTTTTTTTITAGPTTIRIEVKGGKPVGGITHADVKKDDHVVLVVHSDVADEIHLHGYDKHVDVAAGGTARLPFVANIAGVFEAELESRKLQILELTVK